MKLSMRLSAVSALAALTLGAPAAWAQTVLTPGNAVNGLIVVPNTNGSPVKVTGDGNTEVSVWFPLDWSPLINISSGSGTVTENHATGQVTTLQNVPKLLFSDGWSLDLTGAQPVSVAPTATSASGAILHAATVPTPTVPADVVGMRLENNTGQAMPSRVVSFGQAFARGDLPPGYGLVATAAAPASGVLPVQMDVKARHSDGSVRHAVLTIKAPALPASSAVNLMLSRSSTAAGGTLLTAQGLLASGYNLRLALSGASINTTVNAASVLQAAIASGSVQTWLAGPYAAEYRVSAPLDGHLRATFDIRTMADGGTMTDVTVANDYVYAAPQTYTYSAQLIDKGATVWQADGITQGRFQEWHKNVLNETAGPHVVFDVGYLEKAGALPNFDLSTGVATNPIQYQLSQLSPAATAPLGSALITEYMGQTGGRDDIGPTTNWSANYLVAQSEATQTIMLANAAAAASIPWHVRETNGLAVTADTHPGLWIDYRCSGADCAAGGFDPSQTGWTLDFSHEPDLSYVPYLVTGSHFYLDQLQAEANATLLSQNPDYRGPTDLLYVVNQIRGTAWNLRDIVNAAWITPDADPSKNYFVTKSTNNLTGLDSLYVKQQRMSAFSALQGFIFGDSLSGTETETSPWEEDFVAMTLSQSAAQGFAGASDLSGWMTNFIAGRFLHGIDGFNPLHGPSYRLDIRDPATGAPLSTWAQFYNVNFAGQPAPTELDGYPTDNAGYAAIARAANAALFSSTGSPNALQAFSYVVSQTPALYASFQSGNSFNINPRLPDGHVLQNSEIVYAGASGGTVTAATGHSLLIGSAGATLLRGASGVAILYAGTGPTTLVAAKGANYLFPGAGRGTVTGAPGASYVKIGTGPVQINLNAADNATDTIMGFRPGIDHIHVAGLTVPIANLVAAGVVTNTAAGSSIALKIGINHAIVLGGVTASQALGGFD